MRLPLPHQFQFQPTTQPLSKGRIVSIPSVPLNPLYLYHVRQRAFIAVFPLLHLVQNSSLTLPNNFHFLSN